MTSDISREQSRLIVVDTTAFFDDPRLRHISWMQILALSARGEIRLVVPHVVLREAVRHWKRQADKALRSVNAEITKLKGFGLDMGDGLDLDLVDVEAHEQYLTDRLVNVGAKLADLPASATPEKLLERDLGERKPFTNTGKGFRDALNWETILEIAADPTLRQVYWVSRNSADFGDGLGGLHRQLIEELQDPGQVVLVPSLDDLIKRSEFASLVSGVAASPMELEQHLASALSTAGSDVAPKTVDNFIRDAVVDAAERLVGEAVESRYSSYELATTFDALALPSEVSDLTIEYVDADPDTVQWQLYDSFDGTTLLLSATIKAHLSFDGFADKSDALHAEEFQVREFDWNDHVSCVSFSRDATLSFQLRVEEGVGVEYVEFEGADPSQ